MVWKAGARVLIIGLRDGLARGGRDDIRREVSLRVVGHGGRWGARGSRNFPPPPLTLL